MHLGRFKWYIEETFVNHINMVTALTLNNILYRQIGYMIRYIRRCERGRLHLPLVLLIDEKHKKSVLKRNISIDMKLI